LILEKEQQQKEEEEENDDYIQSPLLLSKYDEFAAQVVAVENKKKSEQNLKGLIN
jgi:hypothetical protein